MKRYFAVLIPLALMLSLLVPAWGAHRPSEWDKRARRAKATYIANPPERFGEERMDDRDRAYALIEHAWRLDPESRHLIMERCMFMITQTYDSLLVEEALSTMDSVFDADPSDKNFNQLYTAVLSIYRPERELAVQRRLHQLNPENRQQTLDYLHSLVNTRSPELMPELRALADSMERVEGLHYDVESLRFAALIYESDTARILSRARYLADRLPHDASLMSLGAMAYDYMERPDSARAILRRAVAVDSTDVAMRLRYLQFLAETEDSVEMDRELFSILTLDDVNPQMKGQLITNYVVNLYEDSLAQPRINAMFRQIIDTYPREANLRGLYASYLSEVAEDFSSAADQMAVVVEAEPENESFRESYILYLLQGRRNEEARAAADRAIERFPQAPRLYFLRAMERLNNADSDEDELTLADLEMVNRLAPDDYALRSSVELSRGDLYMHREQLDSAIAHYKLALDWNSDNRLAANNLAYNYALLGINLDEALALARRALAPDPENPTTLDTYAWVLFKRQDYPAAKEQIDHALELLTPEDLSDAGSWEVLSHAGDIYFMNGLPQEAVDFWSRALLLKPDDDLLRRKVEHKTFFYE